MRTPKKCYSYMVLQPDRYGIWIRQVSGAASDCRQFVERVKKLFPNAMYRAAYVHRFPKPISITYAIAGEDLFKIENYYAQILEEKSNGF